MERGWCNVEFVVAADHQRLQYCPYTPSVTFWRHICATWHQWHYVVISVQYDWLWRWRYLWSFRVTCDSESMETRECTSIQFCNISVIIPPKLTGPNTNYNQNQVSMCRTTATDVDLITVAFYGSSRLQFQLTSLYVTHKVIHPGKLSSREDWSEHELQSKSGVDVSDDSHWRRLNNDRFLWIFETSVSAYLFVCDPQSYSPGKTFLAQQRVTPPQSLVSAKTSNLNINITSRMLIST